MERATHFDGLRNGPAHAHGSDAAARVLLEMSLALNLATRGAVQPKQHTEALAHIDHDVGRSLRLKHDASSMPVKSLDVVRENNSGDLSTRRQRNLERVVLHVSGDRAREGETRLQVVGARGEDQGGTPTALLGTSLRITR
jgi:hypothetical protein